MLNKNIVPKVSIIIPVFNAGEYLEKCLESVINQKIDKEIICVDDGSTDNSLDILKEYSDKYSEILIVEGEHAGTGIARNIGIKKAVGEFIAFMDADDYYPADDALSKLYDMAISRRVNIAGGNIVAINKNGDKYWHGDLFDNNGYLNYYEYQDIYGFKKYIYNRRIFDEEKFMFPPYIRFEDPPFFMNIMAANPELYVITDVVYCHLVEHKEISYSYNIALGLLNGIRDAVYCAMKNNLKIAYDNYLKRKLKEHFRNYYKYLYDMDEAFWHVIGEISSIEEKWIGETQWNISKFKYKEYVDYYEEFRYKCEELKANNTPIIIYGAGVGAHEIFKGFFRDYCHLIGYAVTDISNERYRDIEGIPVKEIDEFVEYKSTAVVVISSKRFETQTEIVSCLDEKGFVNVIKLDYDLGWFLYDIK